MTSSQPTSSSTATTAGAARARGAGHAYLSDFGMSQAFPPGQVIAADQIAGMLDYLAPEQIEGRAVDGRADLYSLACTGFELLCGTPPFGPDQGLTLMYAQLYAHPPAASARRAGPTPGGGLGAGHRAGEGPGRPLPELRPVRRGTARRARPAAGRAADPPRRPHRAATAPSAGPAGSAGRAILRVREQQRPGAADAHAAAKDSHAVAADRPAGAGSRSGTRPGRPPTGRPDPGGPDPERSARRSAPAGPCWRPAPWSW